MKSEPEIAVDLLIGQVLGGAYRVNRLLGRGGMGSVYEATHIRLPKRFAIKFLQKDLVKDKDAFARFQREAEIASSLGNRHIVEVFDFNFLPDGSPYMVMEFLQGEDLGSRLRRVRRLPPEEVVEIVGQVASALGAAHKRGIIHRDLKPENIFLCAADEREDFVKLVDFGISKIRSAQHQTITSDITLLGTPAYMSPEQARGDSRNVDFRTDVYALGAVAYEALTGVAAFRSEHVYGILMKIANEMPAAPSTLLPDLPGAVDELILAALSKDPARRPASATHLARALRRAVEDPTAPQGEAALLAEAAELAREGRRKPAEDPTEIDLEGPVERERAREREKARRASEIGRSPPGITDAPAPAPEPEPAAPRSPSATRHLGSRRERRSKNRPRPLPARADAGPDDPTTAAVVPPPIEPDPGPPPRTESRPVVQLGARKASTATESQEAMGVAATMAQPTPRSMPPVALELLSPEPAEDDELPMHRLPRRLVRAGGVAVGVLALAGLYFGLRRPPPAAPVPPPRPAALAPTAPVPAPTPPEPRIDPPVVHPTPPALPLQVRIELHLSPPDAYILLDDVPVSGRALVLDRSDRPHRLQVSAEGYQTRILPIVPNASRELRVDLRPKVRLARPHGPSSHGGPPAPTKKPASPLVKGSDL